MTNLPPLADVLRDLAAVLRAHPNASEVIIAEGVLYGSMGAPIAETLRRNRAIEEIAVPRGIIVRVDKAPVEAPWVRLGQVSVSPVESRPSAGSPSKQSSAAPPSEEPKNQAAPTQLPLW